MVAIGKTCLMKTFRLTRAVYWHYKQWRAEGTIETLMGILHSQVRSSGEKKAKWTTLIIIDSQAVKNTCNANLDSKGFCHYKGVKGSKRHLAVDTLIFPFFTDCTQAHVSDDQGLIQMLSPNLDYFRAKRVNPCEDYHPA
ncbi:transposase [Chlorogloea sp. CCALA 695]|uniref:transposase n=1 Tax=Chlorogloea sp. CCALA 695 TaxID=2107693 RepID=UPI0030DD78C7